MSQGTELGPSRGDMPKQDTGQLQSSTSKNPSLSVEEVLVVSGRFSLGLVLSSRFGIVVDRPSNQLDRTHLESLANTLHMTFVVEVLQQHVSNPFDFVLSLILS